MVINYREGGATKWEIAGPKIVYLNSPHPPSRQGKTFYDPPPPFKRVETFRATPPPSLWLKRQATA